MDRRLTHQALVGLICFSLNLALMWWLVAYQQLHVLVATVICFFALNALGHTLSRRFVFFTSNRTYGSSLLRHTIVVGTSLALNVAAMAFAIEVLGVPYLLASACIAATFFLGNFVAHRDWTFR